MAQVVTRSLVDDLDGGTADETVTFGIDRGVYELDLSSVNAGELRDSLARYLAKARRVNTSPRAARSGSSTPARNREQTAAIRNWARGEGMQVSDRGRISAEVQGKFDAAHTASGSERQMAWA